MDENKKNEEIEKELFDEYDEFEEDEKLSLGEKLKCFFINPTRLFRPYISNPKFAINLIILGAISVVFSLIQANLQKPYTDEVLRNSLQGADPATMAQLEKMTGIFQSPLLQAPLKLVGFIIGVFFMALVYFLIVKLFRGKGTYSQMVSVYLQATYATAIGYIVKIIFMLISGEPTGLSLIQNPSVQTALINYIDIFKLWYLFLLGLGISVVFKISKIKSYGILIVLFLIGLFISISPYLLTSTIG
ncbi:Yip1 family protein [Clostridium sp. DL1XJH146]